MNQRKIACPLILNSSGELIEGAIASFDNDNRFEGLSYSDNIDSMAGVEYYDGILMAGMTNAHCHLELSYLLGQVGQGGGLVEFIRRITAVRGDFPFELQQKQAIVHDRIMWSEGVQAVADISNGEASFEAKRTSNIAYHTFAEYFNMPPDDEVDDYYAQKTAHIAVAQKLGLTISPTPHSTYLVGDKLFKKARNSDRCSIHFMETGSEIDFFERSGAMYDMICEDGTKPDFLYYGGHASRLIGSLPADMPLLLVHNTQCKKRDIEQLMAYFTNLTFVLCPRSNYYIERAFPPAMMLAEMGARVAMGTDSLTSNHSLSMAAEIEWLSRTNDKLPLSTILQWATRNGAEALGLEDKIGGFDVGKKCGAVLLTGVDLKSLRPTPKFTSRRLL